MFRNISQYVARVSGKSRLDKRTGYGYSGDSEGSPSVIIAPSKPSIPHSNLALMLSKEDGGMLYHIRGESWGGNAGDMPDGRLCAGANFYVNPDNGAIGCFGNHQDVPPEIRTGARGIFRVAADSYYRKFEIVTAYVENPDTPRRLESVSTAPNISEDARKVLLMSVELFNTAMAPDRI